MEISQKAGRRAHPPWGAVALAAALLGAAAPAAAHDGHEHGIGWTLTPLVTGPLALAALLYGLGLYRLARRSARGGASLRRGGFLFAGGWAVLAASLVSPLHAAGEVSFVMHMIEHEAIMLVAALLLAASAPGAALLWAFPRPIRRRLAGAGRLGIWRVLSAPVVATAIQGAVMVGWHVPGAFDLALRHEAWHVAQHLSFLGSALLFWRAMLDAGKEPRGQAVAAACLFATALVGGVLGALMALAESPWYAAYAELGMTPFGLTPAQDQQIAGMVMWVPGGLYHMAAALWFLVRALKDPPGTAPNSP